MAMTIREFVKTSLKEFRKRLDERYIQFDPHVDVETNVETEFTQIRSDILNLQVDAENINSEINRINKFVTSKYVDETYNVLNYALSLSDTGIYPIEVTNTTQGLPISVGMIGFIMVGKNSPVRRFVALYRLNGEQYTNRYDGSSWNGWVKLTCTTV